MKRLDRMLLINWYFFRKEIIEFDTLTFLTGKNAVGKSTIIDALQLVLLADTSGSFFNKAANGKSRRTLPGYLRGELTDDGGGGFTYLRNEPFTSYIVLEFYDEEKDRFFTAGCCFDYYSDGDIPHRFFGYFGKIPSDTYLQNGLPLNLDQLRRWLNSEHPESSKLITPTGKEFREYLYAKLGGLQSKFYDLFKKAVPFNPIIDIQRFITEFVFGNERSVDIQSMQETIRSYDQLEQEESQLEKRRDALAAIHDLHAEYLRNANQVKLNDYIADRAACDLSQAACQQYKNAMEHLQLEVTTLTEQRRQDQTERDALSQALIRVRAERASSGLQRKIERLEQECAQMEQRIQSADENYQKRDRLVQRLMANWHEIQRRCALPCPESLSFSDDRTSVRFENMRQLAAALSDSLLPLLDHALDLLSLDTLDRLNAQCADLLRGADLLKDALQEEQAYCAKQLKALLAEQAELNAGRTQYPSSVQELRRALEARLSRGESVPVRPVAELWDVRDPAWRNALEGYLNTQRYNLLVPPAYYQQAVRIYNEVKTALKIHNVAIVDLAAVQKAKPFCQPGSLAEEIVTEDADARAYANYLLGRVMKCRDLSEHNRQNISITMECMLYHQKSIRHLNPEIWKHPLLGQGGRLLRLKQIAEELPPLRDQSARLAKLSAELKELPRQESLGISDLDDCRLALQNYRKIPENQTYLRQLKEELDGLDRAPLLALQEQEDSISGQIKILDVQIRQQIEQIATKEAQRRIIRDEKIPAEQERLKELQLELERQYPFAWREETGEPRYLQEVASHANRTELQYNFRRSGTAAKTKRDTARQSLIDARAEYNRIYQTGFDIQRDDNEEFDRILSELLQNRLPAYLEKIRDAKQKATEQFRDEFIGVLHNNIRNAEKAIGELNRALRIPFSEDTYAFKVAPNPEYRRFYDMLTDEMAMENYSLFSDTFNQKYQAEIDELFRELTSDSSGDVEKRVALYTNYRTYLSFDLTVTSSEGLTQHLSKTMDKKSGGETQTPFYIAVLASFAQIYRMDRDQRGSTIRLIVFDEAFSKMDGDRIAQSIRILRDLHFQVILSAPTDKIGDIATLVDRNLCVLRQGHTTIVRSFDPRETHYDEANRA